MPVREKGEGVPVRRLHVPSHVPGHTQTAAKVRGFSPTAPGCTAEIDSPLEEGVSSEPVSGARPRGQAIDPVKPGGEGGGGYKKRGSTPCTSSHRREKYV